MARTIVRTRDDTERPDLGITLDILNFEAQAIRRTRYAGTASAAYELQHDQINAVLDAWCDVTTTYFPSASAASSSGRRNPSSSL